MARMKNEYDFVAGIHFNDELNFNRYRLAIDFYSESTATVHNQNIAVERMMYMIQDIFQKGIFVAENDRKAITKYSKADIPVFTVPSPGPVDPIVLATITTKLNAILEENLVITDAELTSSLGGFLTYVWDYTDDDDEIHSIVSENDDDVKWWVAPTIRYYSYPEGTDVEEYEAAHPLHLTWELLGLGWSDSDDAEPEEEISISNGNKKIIKFDFTK